MRRRSCFPFASWLLLAAFATAQSADVLTQHNNNQRTGVNDAETTLAPAKIKPDAFGKLWTLYADGQVIAQPLYVSQLNIDTGANPQTPPVQGTFNAVIVATMHNTVYVYDADKENRLPDGKTKPLWARWLGQPRPGGKDIDMWSTNDPEWGILGTPVIDAQKSTVWVVAWHNEDGKFRYRLHALNLKDGTPIQPAALIGGAPADPSKPCDYAGGYNPCTQKQRMALLLHMGVLYVAFGGDGNRGCMFAFDAASLQQVGFWSVTPDGKDGGLWQSGQGPAADADGHVYVMTGNGSFDADRGGSKYGDSFVKLKLENSGLQVKDYFSPCNQKFMSNLDMDLGSAGPVLVPDTNLLLGGGKEGVIYLLSRTNLGKYAASPNAPNCNNPNVVQEFQATSLHVHGAGTVYGHIHGSPVFWKANDGQRMYVWGENDRLKAYTFRQGKFIDLDKPKQSLFQPPNGMPGGMLAVSSKGTQANTGIVWAVAPLNGDANQSRGVQGVVFAFDARDVSKQLWSSEVAGARDRLGLFAKFVPPTVAGGKVFVPTYGDNEAAQIYGGNARPNQLPAKYYVAVYGMLPDHVHPKPIVNQDSPDVTVVKANAGTPMSLAASDCSPAAPGVVDCTSAFENKFGTPSIHSVLVPNGFQFAGCQLLRITTASKTAAITAATGLGWYAADATAGSQSMTSGRFVTTGQFKQSGTATLKGGAPAVLHEFIAIANCTAGQASQDRLFKPYLQFENAADGNVYRNWDLAENYRISRAILQFDRSAEILAP